MEKNTMNASKLETPIVKIPKKIGCYRLCDKHDNLDYLGILLHSIGVPKKKLKKTKGNSNVLISFKIPNEELGSNGKYTIYSLLKKYYNIHDKDFPHKFINYNDKEKDLKKRREYFINFLRRNDIDFVEK